MSSGEGAFCTNEHVTPLKHAQSASPESAGAIGVGTATAAPTGPSRRASHRRCRKSHPAPRKPRGYVIYRGPSLLTGEPIVCVLALHSENVKTGNMAQAFILPDHGERLAKALRSGRDASVCGACKHRPVHAGTCYVVGWRGPTQVWDALMHSRYPDVRSALHVATDAITGRIVRISAYGDPTAVPLSVWQAITARASGWVGYTHQWYRPEAQGYRDYCMASVDSEGEKRLAENMGWRTYRIRLATDPLLEREVVCPASDEGEHKLQCVTCGACNGSRGRRGNIAIVLHGVKAIRHPEKRFAQLQAQAIA